MNIKLYHTWSAFSELVDKLLRRNRWLYLMISLLIVCLCILIVVSLWYSYYCPFIQSKSISSRTAEKEKDSENPEEKNDRLAIMNLLNTFNMSEAQLKAQTPPDDVLKQRVVHLKNFRESLDALQTVKQLKNVKHELLVLTERWIDFLENGEETKILHDDLITLGEKYPWLNALMWIIALNRL